MPLDRPKLEIPFFLLLFAAVSALAFFVFRPFLDILLFAAVFAVLLYPSYEHTEKFFGGRKNMAALAVTLATGIFLVVPFFFLGGQIVGQAKEVYDSLQGNGADYAIAIERAIETPAQKIFPEFSFNTREYAGKTLAFVANNFAAVVSGAAYVFFAAFIALFALFFFLRDGRSFLASLISLSPLERKYDDEIISKVRITINSVVKGTVIIALVQGAFVGVGFLLFGIPGAVLWGSIASVAALVPGIGTGIVMIPAAAYLFFQGNIIALIGFALWGFLIVGLVDNFLRPVFYGKGSDVPLLFVLFSVLGGLSFFGALGFIFGPIVLSLFVSMIRIYRLLLLEGEERGDDGR